MNACEAAKDGTPGPSRTAAPVLRIPAWEKACAVALDEDCLALGDRLRPVDRTDERVRAGGWTASYPRSHYDVAPGAVVVVAPGSGRVPHRAYVAGADGVAEISFIAAGDLIDPAGAIRRAWHRRVRASGLTATPTRHRMTPGHGFDVDTVYDRHGQEHVALCTRAATSYVWFRAVTYAEAVELGVA